MAVQKTQMGYARYSELMPVSLEATNPATVPAEAESVAPDEARVVSFEAPPR